MEASRSGGCIHILKGSNKNDEEYNEIDVNKFIDKYAKIITDDRGSNEQKTNTSNIYINNFNFV